MIKIIFGLLLKIRVGMQALFAKFFEKIRDPKTGKIDGISPRNIVMILWIAGIVFFFMVIASQLFTDKNGLEGGADAYRKELTPKIGINDAPSDSVFDEDPLGDMLRLQNANNNQKEKGDSFGRFELDGVSNAEVPSKDECIDLMNRMQKGEDLIGTEKDKLNTCMEKNIGGWSEDQLQFAQALLNDPTLTPDERELLRRGLAGQLSPEELALAKALTGKDPVAKELARQAIKANADEEARKALAAALSGKQLTDDEKAKIADIVANAADALDKDDKSIWDRLASIASSTPKDGSTIPGIPGKDGSDGVTPAQLEALTAEMAAREKELRALQQQMAEAQAAAQRAGQKLATGQTLSPSEQAAIARLAELQKRLAELEKAQNERRILVMKTASKLQKTLSSIANTIDEVIPTSFSVAYEDAPLVDCKPIGKNIARVKKRKTGPVVLGLDGKPLSPDKVKLLALRRKELSSLDKARDNIMNPTDGFTKGNEALDAAAVMAQNGDVAQELQSLVVFSNKNLKPFSLTPDMKVPAVLLNTILVSNKGRPQSVRVKVLDDVYNPESSQLVIPKGSIIVGTTQSFDEDTGIMDLSFDKVSVGSGKVITAKFNVGSADGSMGLKGEIRDTRGKYLLGAFVTAFSSGALNWFSQRVVQPFLQNENAGTALMGAGLGGGAEVMTKIAEMYAGDLQNAAKIYHVPKGVPLIMYPND